MMKRIYILIWALAVAMAANALDISGYPVGYCNGDWGKTSKIKYEGENVEISAAVRIPRSYASTVAGNSINTIRLALCSKFNVDTVYVWVRESLDGENVAGGSKVMSEYKQGWNEVALDTPYQISEDTDGFYLGMTYIQKKKSGPVSILTTPRENALWVKNGAEEWADRSSDGILCIEGMVYGDSLPRHNAEMLSVVTDRFFVISDGVLSGAVEVRNLGVETIRQLTLSMGAEGMAEDCHATVDCDIPYGEIGKVGFSMTPGINERYAGSVTGQFRIDKVNGADDEDYSDNSGIAEFGLLEYAFRRMALVEEFTTENCPNCPRVAGYIHELMADPQYSSRMIPLCHHAGYGEDPLTTSFAREYEWFYNNGGATYAPATMVDRMPHSAISPLFCPGSIRELSSAIDERLGYPAMVSVEISPIMMTDEGGRIRVEVCGVRTDSESVPDDVRITVLLVENDIKARYQAGVGGDYYHSHVGRDINSTWGEPVVWNGDSYTYTYDFDIDPSWNTGKMAAVAYISHYNPDDALDCEVKNAAICELGLSGVGETAGEPEKKLSGIFTADGIPVDAPVKGVNVLLFSDGSRRKIIVR